MVAVDKLSNSSNNKKQQQQQQQQQRIILVVKIPDFGLTKKILFDRVDTIKDAVDLIIEKLPPGCVEGQLYNIYLPQKSKWCKLDSPFSKYNFKENQEIEFKKDTRSGVSHILSNVGNLMKPYRTVYIKLPEIIPTGILFDQQQQQSGNSATSSTNSTPRLNRQDSSSSILPTIVTPNTSISRSSLKNSTSSMEQISSTPIVPSIVLNVKPTLSVSTPAIGVPKLNLSSLASSSSPQLGSIAAASSPSSSPRSNNSQQQQPIEQKKSLLKIITGSTSTPRTPTSADIKSTTGGGNITPRNLGTFSRSSEESMKIESFDFDDDVTLKEIISKIHQKYQHIDRDLLEDYSLIKDGEWLTDKSKTLHEAGIKHMDEIEFKRYSQKVKIIFLNRELLISLNPNDTLKDINYKIITQYLPSLIKLHRSSSISVQNSNNNSLNGSNSAGGSGGGGGLNKSFRSSISIEPINLLLLEQNYLDNSGGGGGGGGGGNGNSSRTGRSHSDASPLSFSTGSKEQLVLPQQQSVENVLIKRKSSFSNSSSSSKATSSESEKPLSIQLGHNYSSLPQELQEFKDFKLYLSPKYISPNISNRFDLCLDEKRTLSSFNFWNNVKLHFKNSNNNNNSNIIAGALNNSNNSNKSILKTSNINKYSVPFYLVIESEAFNISSVITIENSSTVYDAIRTFTRFLLSCQESTQYSHLIKLNDSLDEYGLYFDTVDSIGKRDGFEYTNGGLIYLDNCKSLSQYPIEPMDRLIFKRTNHIFAILPSAMLLKLDPIINLEIPSILIELKSKFIQLDGFSQEGLFRVNNYSETAFQAILQSLIDQNILDKSNNDKIDPHSIISFIKRWFMKLPRKLLSDLDDETLLYASTLESAAEHTLESSITTQPLKSLLQWLVRFLAEVIQNNTMNKMSVKNLSLSAAPLLIGGDYLNATTNIIDSSSSSLNLEKLNQSQLFLQHLIKLKLKELGFNQSKLSNSISISNNSMSSSVVSLTGSNSTSSSLLSSSLISRSPSLENFNQ